MARMFGTDGVRGKANVELTPELAYNLGRAAAIYFTKTIKNWAESERPKLAQSILVEILAYLVQCMKQLYLQGFVLLVVM